jgi:hypothetical protein
MGSCPSPLSQVTYIKIIKKMCLLYVRNLIVAVEDFIDLSN